MFNSSGNGLPTISIITPSFNAESTIEQTIISIISQAYRNIEYIIVDGNSRDGTVDILRKYSKFITCWSSEPDDGQYDAINKGFSRSTGEIMCWLNADDMLLPGSLLAVAQIFDQMPTVQWLSTLKPSSWDADGFLMGHQTLPGFSRRAFLDGFNIPSQKRRSYCIQQESTFWRRGLWEKAGARIPKEFRLAGDFALWASFYGYAELYGVDYQLAGFRALDGQRSQDLDSYRQEAILALKKAKHSFGWKPELRSMLANNKILSSICRKSKRLSEFGYSAAKITKISPRLPGCRWDVKRYRFVP